MNKRRAQVIKNVGILLGAASLFLLPGCKAWQVPESKQLSNPRSEQAPTPLEQLTSSPSPPGNYGHQPHPAMKLSEANKTLADRIGLRGPQIQRLEEIGFVVTPVTKRYGVTPSNIYDEIYQRDLPVFITSDSILYAFHRKYLKYLSQLERDHLAPMIQKLLTRTRNTLAKAVARKQLSPQQAQFAHELDLYLSVPLYLLDATKRPKLKGSSRTWLKETVAKIQAQKTASLELFGHSDGQFDFSRFKPRGHYAKYRELRPYFQVMTWLGQVPIPLERVQPEGLTLDREGFDRAATLSMLIEQSGQLATYRSLVKVLDSFVGPADDEGPLELLSFLDTQPGQGNSTLSMTTNASIQRWLGAHDHERSRIVNQAHLSSMNTPHSPVPRNFFMLGQRYLLDAEVFQNLVYDRLKHPKNPKRAILRKLPKTLDVIAALGNPRAKTHLKDEFQRYPYEQALDTQTANIAALPKTTWTQNIHTAWLAAIASLHQNEHTEKLPALFRSPAWQDKTLQTQMASWAELRHDHLLYGKQSYSASILCEFTGAYVEPVPEFFERMKTLVSLQHAHLDELESLGFKVNKDLHENLIHFSTVMDILHGIALKETKQIELSAKEKHFLKQAVESETVGCGSTRWDGWYPKLTGVYPNVGFEPTIADVHTDLPDQSNGFKRRILHAATGKFELATIVMDCAQDKQCLYVGPVSSFYEFVSSERINDQEWWKRAYKGEPEGRPTWTQSFRVPEPASN